MSAIKGNQVSGKKKGLSREERAEEFGYPKRKQPADVGAAALGRQKIPKAVKPIGKPEGEKYEGTKPIGKPNPEKNRKAIFANENMDQDVTFPPDPEMFEQEDQTIKGFSRGGKIAIQGTKFTGVK